MTFPNRHPLRCFRGLSLTCQRPNEDFDSLRDKITRIRTKAAGLVDSSDTLHGAIGGLGADGDGGAGGDLPRELMPELKAQPDGELRGNRVPQSQRTASKRGGFSVEFKAMGLEADRAMYREDERKIYINLDHPQLVSAKGSSSTEDPTFRRLAYEVAFTEYAIAISYELVNCVR